MKKNCECESIVECGLDKGFTLGDKWRCKKEIETQETAPHGVVLERIAIWQRPEDNQLPDGDLIVAVKTNKGIDTAIVYINDDGRTLMDTEYQDVWTAWEWQDVTMYALLNDILPAI